MNRAVFLLALTLIFVQTGAGMVMNENTDELPPGCDEISGWENITVNGGKQYAKEFNGKMFTFDQRTYEFDPCTKVSVTFVNNDSVRHQWMVHDLPMETYDMGMFTIEVTGPGKETGTFILPSGDRTLMVHCSVPQHEEKGMKAQIKVGDGDGSVAGIPGVTGRSDAYNYPRKSALPEAGLLALVAALTALLVVIGYTEYVERYGNTGNS